MYASERRDRERIVDFEVRRLERRQALERALADSNHHSRAGQAPARAGRREPGEAPGDQHDGGQQRLAPGR
jgi:hypothetical protein